MKTNPSKNDAQLEARERNLLARMRGHIARDYGFRCGEYEPECCVCKLWHSYDEFALSLATNGGGTR